MNCMKKYRYYPDGHTDAFRYDNVLDGVEDFLLQYTYYNAILIQIDTTCDRRRSSHGCCTVCTDAFR